LEIRDFSYKVLVGTFEKKEVEGINILKLLQK